MAEVYTGQAAALGGGDTPDVAVGPAEAKHITSKRYQDVTRNNRVTITHWFVLLAGSLGWMLDSFGTALYALIIPELIETFHSNLNQMTFDLLIVGLVSAAATYFWPWLADKLGRRTTFIINVAVSSLFLILVAVLSRSWTLFIILYGLYLLAQVGEWGIASCLIAETWPARHRGSALGFARSFYGYGLALAGLVGVFVVAFGWRIGYLLAAVIALLAVALRFACPESPYWLRTQDRKTRIRESAARGDELSEADVTWSAEAKQLAWRQMFKPGQLRRSLVAIWVAGTAAAFAAIIVAWQPLYLHQAHGWSTPQYSTYIIWWALAGTAGYYLFSWVGDRWGRLTAMLAGNILCIVFIVPWAFASETWQLYVLGFIWNFGQLGVWGTILAYTAELFPTRIRGAGQGTAWGIGAVIQRVVPFGTLALANVMGGFQISFAVVIPVLLILQLVGLAIGKAEYAGKDLDAIAV